MKDSQGEICSSYHEKDLCKKPSTYLVFLETRSPVLLNKIFFLLYFHNILTIFIKCSNLRTTYIQNISEMYSWRRLLWSLKETNLLD